MTLTKTAACAADRDRARCPHLVFADLLGRDTVSALLKYVASRECDFVPAGVRDRSRNGRIDLGVRACLRMTDLGPFETPFRACLGGIAGIALIKLGMFEAAVAPHEFEITAYGDGGHFAAHIDTFEMPGAIRVLSCVYYFATTPRRFSGGHLRLHGFATRSDAGNSESQRVDIAPETDTLVVFPSWLRHEVLPVTMYQGTWADQRFAINCWVHRASAA